MSSFRMEDDFSDVSDLSCLSASPSPPPDLYPSPPPSQDADEESGASQTPNRPKTKQRRALPKERCTQHLDLSYSAKVPYDQQDDQIHLLRKTLRSHRKIVVIAGAGISTSAGIPDFRSTGGLFKSLQKKHNLKASGKLLFDAAVYQDDALTASFHEMVRSLSEEATRTTPTAFHHMLARLGQEQRLMRLYTQNIDGIETSMPPLTTQVPLSSKAPWPRTIQLHGSLEKMVCQKCRHLADFRPELFDGPEAPLCGNCSVMDSVRAGLGQRSHGVGKLRPRIVLYNEHNPDEEAIASVMNADIRSRPDALVVVGTSLKIPGVRRLVRNLCKVIRSRRNGVTMWINNEPPVGKEFEDCWDLMVKGNCEEVARLVGLKRWDDNSEELFDECDSSEVERVKERQGVPSVVIPAHPTPSSKRRKLDTGFLTPSSSNDEDLAELRHKPVAKLVAKNDKPKTVRSLTDVLKASTAKAATKPARKPTAASKRQPRKKQQQQQPAPKTTASTAAARARITTFTKVTKSTGAAATTSRKAIKIEKDEVDKAMLPLPLGDARYNGPVSPSVSTASSGKSIPVSQVETVSPSSKPNGYGHLID